MSDRNPDERTPLAPRRGLGGPVASPQVASAQAAQAEAPPASRNPPTGTVPLSEPGGASAADSSGGGAATVTMARVADPGTGTGQPAPGRPAPAPSPAAGGLAGNATALQGHPVSPRTTQTRKARLRMVRIDPWSVMKMAFALSIALAFVLVIAVAIVWSVLDAAGVWESINTAIASLDADTGSSTFDVQQYVGLGRVMGVTMLVAATDVVLLTALATLGAFMYNLAAALLGGLEVTLAEDR